MRNERLKFEFFLFFNEQDDIQICRYKSYATRFFVTECLIYGKVFLM